ncbi:DNA polymerase IV [Microlunatus endophyticus]|uniref:DNA polymerase IV n=1 Tax=Microlunatus endophyticus TaxID=1716077 RepID=A0A917SGK0_9ACTN|nr:DNA polymerase IV [Microlunatus endophyticus]GGL75953.1 DNA polymerase IV [Microlunatus endophyticus]
MSAILHVDMDAFFASVALRHRPELWDAPVIVGGAHRSVVLAANYPARSLGISSGMSATAARRMVPGLVTVPPDYDSFSTVSAGVFAIFDSVTDRVERGSIEEAFLDVTGSTRRMGTPREIGEYIRATVADEQQITCSVGIGPTRFVAKVASRQAKPDGLVEVTPAGVADFLHPLRVEELWGIGRSTAEALHSLGVFTVADLARMPRGVLQHTFGPRSGAQLADLAWGRDSRRVTLGAREHSTGASETFGVDTWDPVIIGRELLRMSDRVARRLRASGNLARTVSISIRYSDFSTINRSAVLPTPSDVAGELHEVAVRLFAPLAKRRRKIRRVGVRGEQMVLSDSTYRQPRLTDPEQGWRELEFAIDAASEKFGRASVQRLALLRRPLGTAAGIDPPGTDRAATRVRAPRHG